MASGDLDESKIAEIVAAGAPVDAFGVGTELATSGDAPSMGTIYKLVEIQHGDEIRYTAKNSPDKHTLPGAKQLFRYPEYDLLGLHNECAGGAEAMLKPVIIGGNLIEPAAIRGGDPGARPRSALSQWPSGSRRTEHSLLSRSSMQLETADTAHEGLLRYRYADRLRLPGGRALRCRERSA